MRVVVFDWDDTLFCTSQVLHLNAHVALSPTYLSAVRAVLAMSLAVSSDNTYIVSSSSPGWIEGCVKQFLPDIADLLQKCTIRLVPAAHHGLGERLKEPSFVSIASECYTSLLVKSHIDFLLIGDMPEDLQPADTLRSLIPLCSVRTWKMTKRPSLDELEASLLSLCNYLAEDLLKMAVSVRSPSSASTGTLGRLDVSSP